MERIAYYNAEQIEIISLANKPCHYLEHNHVSVWTIGLVLEGEAVLLCSGRKSVRSAGGFFTVRPYQIHSLFLCGNYSLISSCIDSAMVEEREPAGLFESIKAVLVQLFPELDELLLLEAVKDIYRQSCPLQIDSLIVKSAHSLQEKPGNAFHVQKLADEVYLSKCHYIKRFKQNIGMTPHKFLLQNKSARRRNCWGEECRLQTQQWPWGFMTRATS